MEAARPVKSRGFSSFGGVEPHDLSQADESQIAGGLKILPIEGYGNRIANCKSKTKTGAYVQWRYLFVCTFKSTAQIATLIETPGNVLFCISFVVYFCVPHSWTTA